MRKHKLILEVTAWLERFDPFAMDSINTQLQDFPDAKSQITELDFYKDNNDLSRLRFLQEMRACFQNELFPTYLNALSNIVNDQLLRHQEINQQKMALSEEIGMILLAYSDDLPNIANDLKDNITALIRKESRDPSSKLKPLVILYCYILLANIQKDIYYIVPSMAVDIVNKTSKLLDNLQSSTAAATDESHLLDMEQFVLIAWDLYKFEELQIAVAHGLRLPNHGWFQRQINNPEHTLAWRALIAKLTDTEMTLVPEYFINQAPAITAEVAPTSNLIMTEPLATLESDVTPEIIDTVAATDAEPKPQNESVPFSNETQITAAAIVSPSFAALIDPVAEPTTAAITSADSTNVSPPELIFGTPNIDVEELETPTEEIIPKSYQKKIKSPKPRIVKSFPAPAPKPKTEEQILFDGFNDAIQRLDSEKFNTLLAANNPNLTGSLVKLLTIKINERHKNPAKIYEFIDLIDLPFEIFLEIFQSDKINIDRLDKLVKRLCKYPVACFFDEKVLKNPKAIRKETLQLFNNRIASNKRWLEEQIDAYLNFMVKQPTELATAKTTWPIAASSFFKDALQQRQATDNPLFKKIVELAKNSEGTITAAQHTLATALQQLARECDLVLATKEYKNSIFAKCETTNNLALLKLFIAMFRADFDAIVANDQEIIHTWVSESTDEFFDALIASLTPEQLALRINQASLLQEASPLARALHLHGLFNPKTNMAATQKHKISVLLKHGATEEILIKKANNDHITIINSALSKGFPEIALMFLNHPAAIKNNITTDGYSLFHYWALYAHDDFEIFAKLYDPNNHADLKLKGQQNLQKATFLHTLLANTAASEDDCLKALTRVFDGYVTSHVLGKALAPKVLAYFDALLLTQNDHGMSLLNLAEMRNWKVAQTYLMKYIEILCINLAKDQELPAEQENVKAKFKMVKHILKYTLSQRTYTELFEAGEFEQLFECIDTRTKFRQDICKAIDATGVDDDILNGETHELLSKDANGDILFDKIFDAEFDDNPLVEKLRQHDSVKKLIKYAHLFSMNSWKEIVSDLKDKTFTDVKPKLERFVAMIKKYKFNIRYHNLDYEDIIDTIIATDNIELSKFMYDSLNMTISSADVMKCIRAKSVGFGPNLQYLIKLHIEHSKTNPLTAEEVYNNFFTDKLGTSFSILEYAILMKTDISIIDFIIECLQQLDAHENDRDTKTTTNDNIINYVLSLAGVLPYKYCYDIFKLILSRPQFKDKLLAINKNTGENCMAAFFTNAKVDTDKAHLGKIMRLLFDHGCDITHIDKCKQNVFHYAMHFGADPEFISFLKDEVVKRHSEQKLDEMLTQVSAFNKRPGGICNDNLPKFQGEVTEGASSASIAFERQAILTPMFNASKSDTVAADKQQTTARKASASKLVL